MQRPDLQPQLASLPAKPGVYLYYDATGEVIYVGKAINLRNRVRSYFQAKAKHEPKTRRLVERVARLDWIVTQSDLEALLLEMNLIKEHRPRYNVLLKDDKRYPFIKVTLADAFPTVYPTRKVVNDGSRYFGPYASAGAMRETLNAIRRVFPFLDCDRTITGKDPRACLYHDIGLCLAPCVGAVDQAGYREMILGLCRFLDGETQPVLTALREQMGAHAEQLDFEQAARVRDRIQAIETVIERQRIIHPSLADQDVIALAREDGSAIAQVFFVRNGKLIGREYFRLEGTHEESDEHVLGQFIQQFYDGPALVPGEIVVPEHLEESGIIHRWLSEKRGTKVRITVPRRGRKRELMDVAVENAAETLRALRAAHVVENETTAADQAMQDLQSALDLPRPPVRIECYDISNLQGTHQVGSMVVFEHAVPMRADYRHFKIKTVEGQDDFKSMEEVLSRRFQRLARHRAGLLEEGAELTDGAKSPGSAFSPGSAVSPGGATSPGAAGQAAFSKTPDLVLIDGGKGQLGVAVAVLQALGLDDIPIASLAKKEELLFRPGRPEPIFLARNNPGLFLVQRARDEAHRFAVTFNRQLRTQATLRSQLDDVPGIGGKRRRALLVHFGSVDGIRAASLEDLAAVPGMTKRAAEQLKAFL